MTVLVLDPGADHFRAGLAGLDETLYFAKSVDAGMANAEILLAQPDLAAEYLAAGFKPAWIQSTWAGVTPLLDAASNRNVIITGVKGIFGPMIAEYVFAYLLADVRDPAGAMDAQRKRLWQPVVPGKLAGKQLAVFGTGSIGAYVAGVAKSFGMETIGISRSGAQRPGFDRNHAISAGFGAVSHADYILVTLPDTLETRGLLDTNFFEAIAARTMLINVGRGNTIDESALISALRSGRLRKAVIDVFSSEPLPLDSELWGIDNLLVTPHIAALTEPGDIVPIFRENLAHFRNNEPLEYVVDLDRGY